MRSRLVIARSLVALYPREWRREYGPELTDILASRPMTSGVAADVVRSGLWQRVRANQPATILGLASVSLILGGFVFTPTNDGRQWTALLQPVATSFPPLAQTFLRAQLYVLALVACGCWTHLRYAGSLNRSAAAAMKMSLIAGLPIMTCALLMMLGIVDATFLQSQRLRPLPWLMMMSPLLRLPESWIWGAIGGLLGRWLSRSSQPIEAVRG